MDKWSKFSLGILKLNMFLEQITYHFPCEREKSINFVSDNTSVVHVVHTRV